MALSILDGNQSATTLSTILSSGQHITAHTVVSLGTQAITDIVNATSAGLTNTQLRASSVTIGGTVTANLNANFDGDGNLLVTLQPGPTPIAQLISGTVTANPTGTQTIAGTVTANVFGEDKVSGGFLPIPLTDSGEAVSVDIKGAFGSGINVPISGTVTANLNQPNFVGTNGDLVSYAVNIGYYDDNYGEFRGVNSADSQLPVTVTNLVDVAIRADSSLPAGTNRIGVVTIGGGTVTIGAGTAQIGSVTASISNSVTIASFATSVTARLINPAGTAVTYAEVGTAGNPSIDVLSVQGVTSGTPINVYPQQGTTVSNTNFTSTTASTTLVSAVALRESLTVFNEGAGNLHISPGATCTTISYQVRLSAGDYWECPQGQLSLLHSAVFATAGTARVCQVS
jgi:hypothetical protein